MDCNILVKYISKSYRNFAVHLPEKSGKAKNLKRQHVGSDVRPAAWETDALTSRPRLLLGSTSLIRYFKSRTMTQHFSHRSGSSRSRSERTPTKEWTLAVKQPTSTAALTSSTTTTSSASTLNRNRSNTNNSIHITIDNNHNNNSIINNNNEEQ